MLPSHVTLTLVWKRLYFILPPPFLCFVPKHHFPTSLGHQPFRKCPSSEHLLGRQGCGIEAATAQCGPGLGAGAGGPEPGARPPARPSSRREEVAMQIGAACGPSYPGALRLPKQTIPQNSRLETRCHSSLSEAAASRPGGQEKLGQGVQTSAPLPTPLHLHLGKGSVGLGPSLEQGATNWIGTLQKHISGFSLGGRGGVGGGGAADSLCRVSASP